MKKFTVKLLAALLTAAALITPAAANDIEFTAAYGKPAVDGKLDAAYKQSKVYTVAASTGASYSKADIYCLWDEAAFYVFADITDDTTATKADTSKIADIWKTDCIEIGVDFTPGEKGDLHKISLGGIYLAAVTYGSQMDVYGKLNDIADIKAATKCVTARSTKGWTVELMIPAWGDKTGVNPAAGSKFGFYAIMHNDTNNDNARDSETYVQLDHGKPNYNTDAHDYVTLQAKPAAASPSTSDAGVAAVILGTASLAAAYAVSKKRR